MPVPRQPCSLSGKLARTIQASRSKLEADTRTERTFSGTLEGFRLDPASCEVGRAPEPAVLALRLDGAGEFELGAHELGRGGMGFVLEGRQRALDRAVALKTIHPHLTSGPSAGLFVEEARILGRLEHPGIVPVHAFGRDAAGQPWLCMKRVQGMAWDRLLAPQTPAERARAGEMDRRAHLRILLRVAEAVAFAHEQGVIHRDLKPANVLVGEFGEVLVTDWGLALVLADRPPPGQGSGRAYGTPHYFPPEMATGDEPRQGPWTDVYLLGGMLYEVLTGHTPRTGTTAQMIAAAAAAEKIPPLTQRAPDRRIPPSLALITLRALDPDPARRFAGAAELAQALQAYLQSEAAEQLVAAALDRLEEAEQAATAGGRPPADVYAAFSAPTADLEQALALFPGSVAALEGLARARLAWARFAIDQGDIAVADALLQLLDAGCPGAAGLRERVAARRAARQRARRRRLRFLGLLAGVLAVAAAAGFFGLREAWRASQAEDAGARRAEALAAVQGASWLDPHDQVACYEEALRLDPLWREGWSELSAANLKHALRLADTDPEACTAALQKAHAANEQALAIDPGYASALYYRGYCTQMRGDPTAALDDFRRAAKAGPETHDGLTSAALVALTEGRWAEAEQLATAAIDAAGDEDDYTRRALARYVRGDLAGGLADLLAAEQVLPDQQDYDALSAVFLLAQGREQEAAARLTASAARHPRLPHVLPLLAYLAARRGDGEQAGALAEAARRERAAFARCFPYPIYRVLAQAPPPLAEFGRALVLEADLAAIAAARPPGDALRLRAQGEAELAAGRPRRALALAEQAIAAEPTDGLARLLAAQCLARLGHPAAARRELTLAQRLAPQRSEQARALQDDLAEEGR